MVVVSLGCTVSVQETAASSLKPPVPRASLAPQKGHRRASLDVSAHVLVTPAPVTSDPDALPIAVSPGHPAVAPRVKSAARWTKTLQTKLFAFWETWAKLSAQITQYKALRPDWVGHTQELFDQQFQRFLSSVGATPSARGAASSGPLAGAASASADNRPVTLTPYLTVADEVEVSFAAMLADLCNMAYDVDRLDPGLLEAHYQLSLIATSVSCNNPGPAACPSGAPSAASSMDSGVMEAAVLQESHQQREREREGKHAVARAAARAEPAATVLDNQYGNHAVPGVVSFTMGGSPPLSPSISMLQLTSPEALTAALTSQGHGAAFSHPVYVSTLHHALVSMGSLDEEGDISDLEMRAAMAARGPRAVLLGGGVGSLGSMGTMGTMGTLDEISMAMMQKPLRKAATGDGGEEDAAAAAAPEAYATMFAAEVQAPFGGVAPAAEAPALGRSGGADFRDAVASGTLFCDASLSEDRDFVAGQFYGYNTQLVERRRSGDGSATGADAAPVAAVAQSGAAGGRALRAEQQQSGRRRVSSAGGAAVAGGGDGVEAVAAAAAGGATMLGALGNETSPMAGGPPVVVACSKAPPSAWLACDDKQRRVRYFAIQGSTSLEHWQINLQFEPVVFEDPKYGVRIHRGVYEAAKILYDDLLPLVKQHLETSPHATVSFAGHSLGGSLGTVLMLLFIIRGVLKPANISPVYTFGAPAVFCQGAVSDAPNDRCAKCHLNCEMRAAGAAAGHTPGPAAGRPLSSIAATAASMDQAQALPLGLMAALGLSDDHVVNVIMHKDIVPRAFVCDYTVVAGMLQRWWPSFRDIHSLQDDAGPHKSLYNFVGRVAVLRPSPDLPFVNGPADASHPMLPNHPALYRVGVHEELLPSMDYAAASATSWDELLAGGWSAMASGCRRNRAATAARRAAKLAGMQKSVMQFMNQPHPLTTLSDYQAYGPHGFVSRFHNPDNYTRALKALSGR